MTSNPKVHGTKKCTRLKCKLHVVDIVPNWQSQEQCRNLKALKITATGNSCSADETLTTQDHELFGEFLQSAQKERLLTSHKIFVHITSNFLSSAQNRLTQSLELYCNYNDAKSDKECFIVKDIINHPHSYQKSVINWRVFLIIVDNELISTLPP